MAALDGIFVDTKEEMELLVEEYSEEVSRLRMGNVNLESAKQILVEAYGSKVPLYQVSTLSAPSAMTLVVIPWDKSLLKPIAEAIASFYGSEITPSIKGESVYVNFPPITQEKKQEYLKIIKDLSEKYRQRLRDVRNDSKNKVEEMKKNGEITEDEYYKTIKKLDEIIREYTGKINDIYEKKKEQLGVD